MYLDETPGIAFTPFNEVLLAGGPLLTAIGGGDFKGATGLAANSEVSVALISERYIIGSGDLNFVGTAVLDRGGDLPVMFTMVLDTFFGDGFIGYA